MSALTSKYRPYFAILRPEQWIKNLLLFFPAFFGQQLNDPQVFLKVFTGFGAFCFLASAVYIINDYFDMAQDRLHPVKSLRPLASGSISVNSASVIGCLCLMSAMALTLLCQSSWFALLLLFYLIQNIAYSAGLKKIPLLDLVVLATGFLIRVFAGGVLIGLSPSEWLVVMIFLGALMIGFGKRRDEMMVASTTGNNIRKALNGYNLEFINVAMVFVSAVSAVAYLMYTLSPEVTERIGNSYVYLTSFLVITGILKYLQLAFVYEETGQPTRLFFRNRALQFIVLLWLLTFALMLYVI